MRRLLSQPAPARPAGAGEPPATAHPAYAVAPRSEGLDEARAYALHPKVALRPERFGALAYSYATRRLSMVRDGDLVDVLHGLADQPSAGAALDAAPPAKRAALARALGRLVETGFVRLRDPDPAGHRPTSEGTP